jgi:phosphotransferase system enzyme I (PtsI)
VGVQDLENSVADGDLVVIDGLKGRVVVNPDEEELYEYNTLAARFESYQKKIIRRCMLPAETSDGFRVKVLANIELLEEVTSVIDHGGEGIGLYRTEYSYLNRTALPDEEELTEKYIDLASIMSPRKVVFRTLDLGSDKIISEFGQLDEANPAMGLRAIRFCLRHPELFKAQLRAILRASVYGNVSMMFPMISGLRELRRAKARLKEAQLELARDGVPYNPDMPVGIMIEVPSAVMIAELLAREVDFFSIGTNDLIQYSLGIDRTNPNVSYLYQPLHPAVLRSIKQVVDAAHQVGIEVSLCGEVASDPFCVPILMGMQIDCISLSPQAIPGIKRIIRQTRMDECRSLLREVISQQTVGKINRMVKESIFKKYPEELTFFASLLDSEELPG